MRRLPHLSPSAAPVNNSTEKAKFVGVHRPLERFDRSAEVDTNCTERGRNNRGVQRGH
jgi:hypothetical protein